MLWDDDGMDIASWLVGDRELVTISMDPVPWDSKVIHQEWTRPGPGWEAFPKRPPDDDPRWKLVGETADGEQLWVQFE